MEWTADRIRETFLDFYAQRDHKRVSSLSLVPPGDGTLLFTNAGMVQFKDIFTGRSAVDYSRAASSQKCLRVSGKHNDLENVGRTARHHTFFEMLGNFSFGDYFKEGAIESAWALITDVYDVPVDQLYVTVHPDDDEARQLWTRISGLPPERILDDPENFWSMGPTGACGPCSEIHFDQGKALSGGEELSFFEATHTDRYLEIWNLVFMQYDRDESGNLTPLPAPSIDTGMGLERITSVLQGHCSNYDSDLFQPIIQRVAALSGKAYTSSDSDNDVAMRVIADHSRAAAFLIADGVYPSNEGRGYVIRRVMRRAMRFARKLGLEEPTLVHTTAEVVGRMKGAFPQLAEKAETISSYVLREEKTFANTLKGGLRLLDKGFEEHADAKRIPGDMAFMLYDTYGFPLDMTEQAAEECGFTVDTAGFDTAMAAQKAAGKASWKGDAGDQGPWIELRDRIGMTTFTGYAYDDSIGHVRAVLEDGTALVCDVTPFYAESGGQVGDVGVISSAGASFKVTDTQRPIDGVVVHRGYFAEGEMSEGQQVTLRVNADERNLTRRNHSATHLLHYALRTVLGDHVKQAGSMVGPHRLRFDFQHFQPVSAEEIQAIETLVNQGIVRNEQVTTDVLSKDEAVARGAVAFFGDKYGDTVRMLTITADSVELCGGTHVASTGDIGFFKVVGESSIAGGVRRIEGVTGMDAVEWVHAREQLLRELAESLSVGVPELPARLGKLQKDHAALEKRQRQLEDQVRQAGVADAEAETIGGVTVLALAVKDVKGGSLRDMADKARAKLGSGVVFVAADNGAKVALLVAVTDDLTGRFPAGKLLGQLAQEVGGRGGGRPDMAQGGGSDPSRIPAAMDRFRALIAEG